MGLTMKFVKRISLFFIYPVTMFGLGFASNMGIQKFFYPGQALQQLEIRQEEPDALTQVQEVSVTEEPVMTADTEYVVVCYNSVSGESEEELLTAPDKFIGLTRQKLEEEIKEYRKSPSLTDLEQGFSYMELVSFSPSRVVVRKSFEKEEETGFFLLNENHCVVVYDKGLNYVYMNTDILTDELPWQLQNEIMHMKFIENETELYNFLESYSS